MSDTLIHDAGGKVRKPLPLGVVGFAEFAGDRREHRLTLERRTVDAPPCAPFVLHCGMNPSTAGAELDDMTVYKDWVYTQRWGFGRMFKVNVGSFVSTDPDGLNMPGVLVNHPSNHDKIRVLASYAARLVIACGDPPDALKPHARTLFRHLRADGRRMQCFGLTKSGWPKHSSRLAYATELMDFRP